jgi:hypothetical protein
MQATALIWLTCFLLISVVQTAEAKWKHIDSSHGALCEVDPKSIEKTPQSTVIARTKIVFLKPTQEGWTAIYSQIEVDCKKGQLRDLKKTTFRSEGKEIVDSIPTRWMNIMPGTIQEVYFKHLCE